MPPTTFRIGGDLTVGRLGFGAMHLPTEKPEDRPSAVAVARRAVELGITLIDTAHMYGNGANEEVLAEALHPYPKDLLITTKVGVIRSDETGEWALNGRPESLRAEVDHALRRLRVDRLELLQLHRIDPETPLDDQLGTLRDLRDAGKVGRIGLSEVTAAELAEAREIVDIASVQNRYNLTDRTRTGPRGVRGGGHRVPALAHGGLGQGGRPRGGGSHRRRTGRHPHPGLPGLAAGPLPGDAPDPGHVEHRPPGGEHGGGGPGPHAGAAGAAGWDRGCRRQWSPLRDDGDFQGGRSAGRPGDDGFPGGGGEVVGGEMPEEGVTGLRISARDHEPQAVTGTESGG